MDLLRRSKAILVLKQKQKQFKLPPLPEAFHCLDQPSRYKVFYGGRGGAKSWSFARKLIEKAHKQCLRILCTRELQNSIKDSVHRILSDQIRSMGLGEYFKITEKSITHLLTGSEFLFKGLHHHVEEIKSTEGIDICWVAEAQNTSKDSWKVLIPTIRKPGSEIWIEFNTDLDDDETYVRFVLNTPPDTILRKVNYTENPYFPDVLEKERLYAYSLIAAAKDDQEREQAQADYDNIWEGAPSKIKLSAIFRGKVVIEDFETPQDVRFYHGVDWGFSNDPTVMIRSFVKELPAGKQELYIDMEAFGHGVEIDDTAQLFDSIPTSRNWPIKADNSRPETISYMRRQGFNIEAARKWPGSVEDGIAHIKGFVRIIIHTRCKHMQIEAKNYCYKIDKKTNEVLPIIIDAWNHGWDAERYALDGYIQSRGGLGVWEKLGQNKG